MSDRYGNVRVTKIKAALDAHRAAVYSGDPEAILETWRTFEQWADIVFRSPTPAAREAVAAITPAEAARVLLGMDYNERMKAVLAIARVAQHPDADKGIGATLATSMLVAALRAIAEGDA